MKRSANRNNGKRALVLVIGLMVAAAIVGGMMVVLNSDKGSSDGHEAESATVFSESSIGEAGELGSSTVSTQYGDLQYPSEYKDSYRIDKKTADEFEMIAFYATLQDKDDVRLFTVCFGNADGTKIGEVDGPNGTVPVYLYVEKIDFDESWSDEEIETVLGMQEGLNLVIESLEANDIFSSEL